MHQLEQLFEDVLRNWLVILAVLLEMPLVWIATGLIAMRPPFHGTV